VEVQVTERVLVYKAPHIQLAHLLHKDVLNLVENKDTQGDQQFVNDFLEETVFVHELVQIHAENLA